MNDTLRRQTQRRRSGSFAWLGLIVAALVAGCSDPEEAVLRIGLTLWPPSEIAFLAAEEGFFQAHDIELIEFSSPGEYLPGFVDGPFDAAVVTLGSALELVSLDDSQRIVMVLDDSRGADALVARKRHATMQDLRGQRVGYEATALGAYTLFRFLEVHGMSPADVVPVPIDVPDQEQAYRRGEIDALVTFEPAVSRLAAAGGRVLIDSGALPGEIMDVLVVRESTLINKREEIEAFARGWFAALALHERDPQAAARRAEERKHFSVGDYVEAFQLVTMIDYPANLHLMTDGREELLVNLRRHRRFLESAGFISVAIDTAQIVDPSIVTGIR